VVKRKEPEKLYGTKQVAEILGIPDWRVKNFTEGEAYRLPKPQLVGTGRGSRRLYTITDICRIAIANQLVECGFSPEAIGDAIEEIPRSLLTRLPDPFKPDPFKDDEEPPEEPQESPAKELFDRIKEMKESLKELPESRLILSRRGGEDWQVEESVIFYLDDEHPPKPDKDGIFYLDLSALIEDVALRVRVMKEKQEMKKAGKP
jgi:DNA-binding transcriptional MerR regulator